MSTLSLYNGGKIEEVNINFALDTAPTIDGDMVKRSGVLFECGDYPDKGLSLSEAEADTAIALFQEANINYNHTPGPFDGKMGKIKKVWRDGKQLLAEFAFPKVLHDLTDGAPIPMSAEWDWSTGIKRILGVALTNTPRVRNAAMMSYFSEQEVVVQDLRAHFSVADLSFEQIRTILCSALTSWYKQYNDQQYAYIGVRDVYKTFVTFTNYDSDSELYKVDYKINADYSVKFGEPTCVVATTTYEPAPVNKAKMSEEKPMSFIDELKALFSKHKDEIESTDITVKDPVTGVVSTTEKADFSTTPEFAELEKLRAEKVESDKATVAKFNTDNEAVIDALIVANKYTPAEKADAMSVRAMNPVVFDTMVKDKPVRAEFNQNADKTVDAHAAVAASAGDPTKEAKFNEATNAVSNIYRF